MTPRPQITDDDFVNVITSVVRDADRTFQCVGGSSRHWVRDCFLPILTARGFGIVQTSGYDDSSEVRSTLKSVMDEMGFRGGAFKLDDILAQIRKWRQETPAAPPSMWLEETDERICLLPRIEHEGVDYINFAAVLLLIRRDAYASVSVPGENQK